MRSYRWAIFEADLDPVAGAEQRGTRPVLVVSNEEFNRAMPYVTVLPLTSTQRGLYPSETHLPEKKGGQPMPSIVMAHQIRTISKRRLGRLLGYLDDPQFQFEIHQAIREHLDME